MPYYLAMGLWVLGGSLLIMIVLWSFVRKKILKAIAEGRPAPFAGRASLPLYILHGVFLGLGRVVALFESLIRQIPPQETRAYRDDYSTRFMEWYFCLFWAVTIGMVTIFVFATLPFRAGVKTVEYGKYTWGENYVFWYTNPQTGKHYNLFNVDRDMIVNGNPYAVALVTLEWENGHARPVGTPRIIQPNDTATVKSYSNVHDFADCFDPFIVDRYYSGQDGKVTEYVVERVENCRKHLEEGRYNYPTPEMMQEIMKNVSW